MGAAPSLPPDYREPEPPSEPPRKRRIWVRVLGWIGIGIVALIVLIVIAAVVLLHSPRFHQWVLAKAEQKASAALGTGVRVRDFSLHLSLSAPTLDLYGVTVYGAQPYPTPPLLQVDHIGAGVRIVSLFSRQWYVSNLRVDHPVVRASVDRNGADNLPKMQTSNTQSHTSVFDLGVRHALLDRGEVYYNNRKSALNADLHDVEFRSAFNTARREYAGTLSYRDGHLQMGTYRPLPHNLDARFTASPATFTLQRAVLSSGPSQVVLTATLENYAQPHLTARYDGLVDTGQFRRIMNNPSLPLGVIRLAGSV